MENLSQKIDILEILEREIEERELNLKFFVMEFHEYRKIWEPKSNEFLEAKLEPTNKMDKFAVAVTKNKKIGHLPLSKTGCFSETIIYFLRCEYNDCKVKIVDDKTVNLGNGMGMRVHAYYYFVDKVSL